MTTPTTPAAAAREQAREITNNIDVVTDRKSRIILENAIAAALLSARQAQLEDDCKAVCEHCAAGLELTETADDCFHTLEISGLPRFPNCYAAPIRAQAAAKESEK